MPPPNCLLITLASQRPNVKLLPRSDQCHLLNIEGALAKIEISAHRLFHADTVWMLPLN